MMKRILLTAAIVLCCVNVVLAQRIEVVDKQGNGVPYATVTTPDAEFIGTTDMNGVLENTKDYATIVVSHIAFKPQKVALYSGNTRITMEDVEFTLDEITASPKPLVYVQTYYRLFFYSEKEGMFYYRVGITDNAYDRQKKDVKANTNHVAKATIGIVKVLLGALLGPRLDQVSRINVNKLENRMRSRYDDIGLQFVDNGPNKKTITDFKGVVGNIVDNPQTGVRRYSYDTSAMRRHQLEAEGNEKKLRKLEKKAEKENEKTRNKKESCFQLYRIDENGFYAPEDFVSCEIVESYDKLVDEAWDHRIMGLQIFATDRAYVTKEELKEIKKNNKFKLTYDSIKQFEADNNIPELAPAVEEKLAELWNVDK